MYFKHLRYFLTLADLEHYTAAAEELSITQPTLSNAISFLELELGVPLFEKRGRNVVLTKYGATFAKEIKRILTDFDAIKRDLKQISDGEGCIDLGFLTTLGTNFVPKMVRNFLKQNEDKNYTFKFSTGANVTQDLLKDLKEGNYDIAICSQLEDEPTIDFAPVAKQEMVIIVHKSHPLARFNAITLEKTLPYPLIAFAKNTGLRPIVDNLYASCQLKPNICHVIQDDQVVAGLVSEDFGIAIVPNMPILNHLNVKVIRISDCCTIRYFYVATRKNSYLPPAAKAFKKFIIKHANL